MCVRLKQLNKTSSKKSMYLTNKQNTWILHMLENMYKHYPLILAKISVLACKYNQNKDLLVKFTSK